VLVKVINFKQNVTVCTLHSGMDLMFCMSVMGVDMEVCMCVKKYCSVTKDY
jgi:hypothetical protein